MLKEWGDVWNSAQKKYEETRTSRKEAIIREVAGYGIIEATDNIVSLRTETQVAEDELRQLGFELDGDQVLDLTSSSSRLAWTIERRLDAEVGTKEVLTPAFGTARIKLLVVASAEEAEKIVEPLFNFEVAVK
jgi:hypothetical protein